MLPARARRVTMSRESGRPGVRRRRAALIAAGLAFAVFLLFFVYTAKYSHADEAAENAMRSDETVAVVPTDYGVLFDGPSSDSALIFYPGGKVDEKAYAPLLRRIAAGGVDVCLVKMPFRLAVFGMNRADAVMARHRYQNWYIGGHSLGGAMAAYYASEHDDILRGLILLAAYPTRSVGELPLLSVYGSEDGVLRMQQYEKGKAYWPSCALEYVIEGGNHAQFGSYGAQAGDETASISAVEQQTLTAELILDFIDREAAQAAA